MCDGYAPFAMAFVTKDIDTTGYEVARSACENAPEVVNKTQTRVIEGKTTPKRRLRRIGAFLSVLWPPTRR